MPAQPGKPKILAVVGPTASGKTDLAVSLARKFKGAIISADSRQIYRRMDIGTAKPVGGRWTKFCGLNAYSYRGVLFFLLDIASPARTFTLAEYKAKAEYVIKRLLKKGKLPILCGGTGLYVRAVIENLDIPEVAPDPKLRAGLERAMKSRGLPYLVKKLFKLDPAAKKFIDPKNPRRVIRALEVCLAAGRPFSDLRKAGEPLYDALQLGIEIDRPKLYRRINVRVDQMMKAGLEKEVRGLARLYKWTAPGLNGLGYSQFRPYFEGKASLEHATQEIKKQTRRYAKRQLTWFKKQPGIVWVAGLKQAELLTKKFLSK